MTRALIEAIGYDLRSIIGLMEERVALNDEIILSGGIARGENIAGIISSILGRPLRTVENAEASLAGAAILGLFAAGELPSLKFQRIGASYDRGPASRSGQTGLSERV
jgi:gluconokinase